MNKAEKEADDILKKAKERADTLKVSQDLDVVSTRNGVKIMPTFNNAVIYLQQDERLKGIFKYNEFAHIIEIARHPPWGTLGDVGKRIHDYDALHLKKFLIKEYKVEMPKSILSDAIDHAATLNSYDPVKNYLNGLVWDNVPRLETWLSSYLGADDNDYTRHVGKLTLAAACARVMQPGIKYDYMLILEGAQGIGKTRTASILGGEWYREISLTERTKDTVEKMQGAWIIEVAELAVFKKRDIESLKAFITNQQDVERLSYDRRAMLFPRRSIFIGTINPDNHGYLSDTSGNRRFLPVSCGNKIDMGSLQRDRDQLWAEALQLYKNGFKLWIDNPKVEEIALEQQQERESQDAWQDKIAKYLADKDRTSGLEIWTECMQGFASEFDRGKQMRIADCLRRLKWDRKTICVDGKHIKGYFAPEKWQHKSPWSEEEDWKNAEG